MQDLPHRYNVSASAEAEGNIALKAAETHLETDIIVAT